MRKTIITIVIIPRIPFQTHFHANSSPETWIQEKKLSNGGLFNVCYNLDSSTLDIMEVWRWSYDNLGKSRSWVKISQEWVNLRKIYVEDSSLISSHQSCLISFLGKKEKGQLNQSQCSDIGFQEELQCWYKSMLKYSCLIYLDMYHGLFSVLIRFGTIVSEYISWPKSVHMYLVLFIWNIAFIFPDKILHHLKHVIMSAI